MSASALGLGSTILLNGCSNDQPKPINSVTYTGIPREVIEVIGRWKMGEYTQGFRIQFDDYYTITDIQGLYGQEGMGFTGPGLVDRAIVESFREIAELCEEIKDKEEINIHGDLMKTKEVKDYLFNGKGVIILYDASYKDKFLEVNRRPWD